MASLKPLWLSVGPLSEQLRRADSLYLGLDFDGTLTPILPDPREAELPARARDVLRRLSGREHFHLAFFSSRTLDDLRGRIGLERVFYAGSSGLETRDELGRHETHAGTARTLPAALLRSLEGWCQRFPGARLEARPGGATPPAAGFVRPPLPGGGPLPAARIRGGSAPPRAPVPAPGGAHAWAREVRGDARRRLGQGGGVPALVAVDA